MLYSLGIGMVLRLFPVAAHLLSTISKPGIGNSTI